MKKMADLAQGAEFFVPIQAFKCRLCDKIFRTEADAMAHFLGPCHNKKYDEMRNRNKDYEGQRNQLLFDIFQIIIEFCVVVTI